MAKRKTEFERMLEDVHQKHSKRMNALLATMDDEDFAVNYFKLLEYASPKLQRSELVGEAREQKLVIEHVEGTKPETFDMVVSKEQMS